MSSPLDQPLPGAIRHDVGGAIVDEVAAGNGRVKRIVYPVGWRWSANMRPVVGTDRCMHAHVGYLAQGHVAVEYADGCRVDFVAPAVVVVAPGHDGWTVGDEAAVLIQFDWARETADRCGLAEHRH
ncbi:MAG TPA: hypothetical protein VKE22_29885 [Haliangiales bacterium]|nr:hypothetical protein [Haliangiales bacterium]